MDFEFTEEQKLLHRSVKQFVDQNISNDRVRELDNRGEFPHQIWKKLSEQGYHGAAIDPEYGGSGGDIITQCIIAEQLARKLAGAAWIWGVSSCFGGKTIGLYGTEEQKQKYLPPLTDGELRFALSVTEPGGGTDVLGHLETRARKTESGFLLNGSKIYTTGVEMADLLIVLARTKPREEVDRKNQGITMFIVPTEADGVEYNQIPTLGLKMIKTYQVYYRDVELAPSRVLGSLHEGWDQLTQTLNNERILEAAICCGMGQGVLNQSLEYAREREAFGNVIGSYQSIQHYVADMKINLEQARLLTLKAAWKQSHGEPCGLEATLAKTAASEMIAHAADRGIQILGGLGYTLDADMQRFWRDGRLMQIGPISNEMARNYIAQELGLPRSY